jgi:hypothetical protein
MYSRYNESIYDRKRHVYCLCISLFVNKVHSVMQHFSLAIDYSPAWPSTVSRLDKLQYRYMNCIADYPRATRSGSTIYSIL